MILSLLIFVILLLGILMNSKLNFMTLRNGSEKLTARVVEYRSEKGPIRNDYTKLDYPYVEIEGFPDRLIRLKYAKSASRPFPLGQEIKVFWSFGILYYWNAYEKGFYKYLPENLKFRK